MAIQLKAFLFTRYGTVKASVDKLIQDAVNDKKCGPISPATLKREQAVIDVDGKAIWLSPGMNIKADIKTG